MRAEGVRFGAGMPKICVPIAGPDPARRVRKARDAGADLVEWRADCSEASRSEAACLRELERVRAAAQGLPILFTFRTLPEGGARAVGQGEYGALCRAAIDSGLIDLIDIECSQGNARARALIQRAQAAGLSVIASAHHFDRTPSDREMDACFHRMRAMGADFLKQAVMPRCAPDVGRLIAAALRMRDARPECRLVAISMSALGLVTRVCGEAFGSVLTFAALDEESAFAPGQIDARTLRGLLEKVHRAMEAQAR